MKTPPSPALPMRARTHQQQLAENEALQDRLNSQEAELASQKQILDQLDQITRDCYSRFPEHTQSVPTVRPGESTLVAVVRRVVNSLGHRVEEVEKANFKVGSAMKAKDRLLANMSHEIRTPLNGVIGMIELLAGSNLDADQREFVDVTQNSAKSLMTLLNDILDFSKLAASRMTLETRVFNPEHSIENALRTFAAIAGEKDIELQYSIAANFPDLVVGDGSRVRQVLSNLVSNSLKFTNEGKIHILATLGETNRDWMKLIFSVRDTGIGMSETELKRIFTPFTQSDSSTSRKFGGTGLGLTISRELLNLMDGTLTATSAPGGGSCFRVELKVSQPSPDEIQAYLAKNRKQALSPFPPVPESGDPEPKPEKRLMLVEDNPVNQRVAQLTLERMGYKVRLASSGYEAIDIAGKEDFKLICMDVSMPGLDGYETTQRIRALGVPTSEARIVAITGHAFDDDRRRCAEAGMDDFVAKPFTVTSLSEALERQTSRAATAQVA
jgi:signal transduction histidine kinase/CheY-like chemotaxis protein